MDAVTRVRFLRRLAALASLVLLPLPVWTLGRASAAEEPLEYQVKAAYLLNFTRFIEWPASAFADPGSPVAICILGEDPFGSTLDQLVAGEEVNGRRIIVRRIKAPPSPQTCHVLFVGKAAKSEGELLKEFSAPGSGLLTVGEGPEFVHAGGVIAFISENRRVRFGINQAAAANAGLQLSARLLNVAKFVEKAR